MKITKLLILIAALPLVVVWQGLTGAFVFIVDAVLGSDIPPADNGPLITRGPGGDFTSNELWSE